MAKSKLLACALTLLLSFSATGVFNVFQAEATRDNISIAHVETTEESTQFTNTLSLTFYDFNVVQMYVTTIDSIENIEETSPDIEPRFGLETLVNY